MVKILGSFEDLGEAAAEAGQTAVSQTKKQVQNAAQTAVGQITGNQNPNPNQQGTGTNEQANAAAQKMSDDQAKKFLQDLYGPSTPQQRQDSLMPAAKNQTNPQQSSPQNIVSQAIGISQADPTAGKTPSEVAEIQSLRNQLHADYYKTLTTPSPKEERAAEKVEREDQEKKMEDLEKQEEENKKQLPVTVKQGTGESVVGVSG